MIFTCPECNTRYQADAAAFLPDGRKVRCARCGHIWFQAPPAPEPEADLVAVEETPEPSAAAQAVLPPRSAYAPSPAATADGTPARPRAHLIEWLGLTAGWIGLAAIIVAIGWSAVRYRQDIANLWPQSSSLYAVVGMPVNTRGIEFEYWNAHFTTEDGQDVLVITGRLHNITTHELTVPLIRVSLSDNDKRELYHWTFSPDVATLSPGQTTPFLTRLSSPPPATRHVELRFAERGN